MRRDFFRHGRREGRLRALLRLKELLLLLLLEKVLLLLLLYVMEVMLLIHRMLHRRRSDDSTSMFRRRRSSMLITTLTPRQRLSLERIQSSLSSAPTSTPRRNTPIRSQQFLLRLLNEKEPLRLESLSLSHFRVLRHLFELVDRLLECGRVVPQKGMLRHLLERAPQLGVRNEHHQQEVTRGGRDPLGERERRVDDVFVEEVDIVAFGVGGIVVVREVASQHRVEDDSTTPNVHGRSYVLALLDDELGSGVAWRSTRRGHEIVSRVFESIRESKIGNDNLHRKSIEISPDHERRSRRIQRTLRFRSSKRFSNLRSR